MNVSLRGCRVLLLAASLLFGSVSVARAADESSTPRDADRGADEAVGALVAFLQQPDDGERGRPRGEGAASEHQHRGPEGRGDRPRAGGHRPGPGGRRPFDAGLPNAARPQPPYGAFPQRGMAGPQFRAVPFAPPVLHGPPEAHVAEQLQLILGKLNAIEARLGGLGPQGPQPGGQPHPFHGHPTPPGHQQPGPGPGGPNPDELNRRFEEHARDLHRHVEEMARGLGEKLKAHGGMAEEFQKHHEKIAHAHEQIQERFQDIRRRFAEQQERIERLEQEVRRLHEAHGAGRADGEGRERKREEKGAKRRDEEKQGNAAAGSATPQVSFDEGSESL